MTMIYFFTLLFIMTSGIASQAAKPMCEDIFPPLHGKLTMDHHNQYYIVRCEPGYAIRGNFLVQCVNGQWNSVPPKCVSDPTAKTCPDIDPPENGNKTCPEGPQYVGSHCRFSCNDGYKLEGINLRMCLPESRWSGTSPRCIPKTNETCPVPSPLINGRVISCSPRKVPTVGRTCHFRCNRGYVLEGPPALFCRRNGKLTDAEWKETVPQCVAVTQPSRMNHGQNNDRQMENNSHGETYINSYADNVQPSSRHQPNLGSDLNQHYANSNQPTFIPASNQPAYRHQPVSGHVYLSTANRRINAEESGKEIKTGQRYLSCEDNNGGCQHLCSLTKKGLVKCNCWSGYILAGDKKSCVDIDECSEERLNRCQHDCHNTDGGYTCSCKQGYHKVGEYKCKGCKKDLFWSYQESRCMECPDNSYTDSEAKLSIDDCKCLPGFTRSQRENVACIDIDECADDNYGCSDSCINQPGSAFCSCFEGYTLDADNKTCIDIDECSVKNGGCQGICHNTEGSFYCSCPEGYTSSNRDIYSCDDVDECLENNGGCAHKCNNYPGGHFCSCEDGFRIGSDLQNCTDIRCPSIPVPHYSSMECKIKKSVLPLFDSYPIGTECTFHCVRGFKNTGPNKVKCQKDGMWTGTVPECKSQRCEALPVPENGAIHPPSCSKRGNTVKQKCTFTCNQGYNLKGKPIFSCKNDLTWSVKAIPQCQQEKIRPTVSCPADITVDLHPGTNTYNITLSAPVTNADTIVIEPGWVTTDSPIEFPAGTTNVVFKAAFSNTKRFSRCTATITVIDREAPVFHFCPDSIEIEDVGVNGIPVTWHQPIASDNVEVKSLTSTLQPNSTLVPGTYMVEYFAKDVAGNVATCTFNIILKRTHCDNLPDPQNGEANCMHWMTGIICNPTCNDGYERHPNDTAFYSCEDSGVWEPADVVTDCLKTLPLTSFLTCPDGYEIVESTETGDEICIECRANTFWSTSTRKCEEQDAIQ